MNFAVSLEKGARYFAAHFFAIAAAAVLFLAAAHAADVDLQDVRQRLDAISATFDSAENTLKQSDIRNDTLVSLRDSINPMRAELRAKIGQLEPRRADVQKRVTELGAAPKEGAAPEDPRITAERTAQTALLAEMDGALKQAKLLNIRGDQILDRIDTERRSRFKERLLTQTEGVLSPSLWIPAAKGFSQEVSNFGELLSEWKHYAEAYSTNGAMLFAPLAILALIAAVLVVRYFLLRYIDRKAREGDVLQTRRSLDVYLAVCRAVIDAAAPPLTAYAIFAFLSALDLISPRVDRMTNGVLTAIAIFSVGCAVTRALNAATRKKIGFDEAAANRLYRSVTGAVAVVAAATLLFTLHRALGAPSAVRTATVAILSALVAFYVAKILSIRTQTSADKPAGIPNFIRFLGWIAVATVFFALLIGRINFAGFIASRLVDIAIISGIAVLLMWLVDAVFAANFSEEGSSRRRMASAVGINPARLDLLATITAGLLKTLIIIIALFLTVGGWRTSVTDVASMFDRFDLAVSIGQSKLALGSLLIAIGILLAGLFVTRIAHRWLTQSVLPRTKLDTGLQNSISTIFIYICVITAGLLALAQIGINLQNIAFVAGALSVGIGFGLQSVVSNFVSGIILLAERPLRVGDMIEVKGESGYVRRISVRSTEIETFDRANVIVPNSDLVTNVVTNWTHANTLGRVKLDITVAYDSDPEKVREILLKAAGEHPKVLKAPAPFMLLTGFGDYGLQFQLYAYVGDVNVGGGIKSDLYFEVLRQFRAAAIEIPLPQREYRVRGGRDSLPQLDERKAAGET